MKTWKNWTLVAIIAFLGIIVCFTACPPDGNGTEQTHTHSWNEGTITVQSTCSTKGIKTFTCTIDSSHTKTEEIPINTDAHIWGEWKIEEDPTCEEDGKGTHQCTLCPVKQEQQSIDALGHIYPDWIEPNCTVAGNSTMICTRIDCGHEDTRTTGYAALGHDWSGWEINTDSISKKICSRCTEKTNGEIGDAGPGGGKIFYISSTGFAMTDDNSIAYYLEAAPNDMVTTFAWASSVCLPEYYDSITGLVFVGGTGDWLDIIGTEIGIGTGRKNTSLILTGDISAPAAKSCSEYSNNGKNDWFLPSKDELQELYYRKNIFGNLGDSGTHNMYWTSSQFDYYQTWRQIFGSLNPGNYQYIWKQNRLGVRAIRAF